MQRFFMGKSNKNVANGNAATSSEMEDGNACFDYVWDDDPSSPLLSSGKVNQTGWVPTECLILILWKTPILLKGLWLCFFLLN